MFLNRSMSLIWVLVVLLLFVLSPVTNAFQQPQNCIGCHQQQHQQWQMSDHAKAMSDISGNKVLGNFNDVNIQHHGQYARFYRKQQKPWVDIGYQENKTSYPIAYTFGHYPLQQYLVEIESGRLHVLPFAWDSRTQDQGGQRWYHIYPDENIAPQDRLHWRQPLQNWNGMCADCHSDGLKRQYNVSDNRFDTQWDNINVGCQSCHGTMQQHSVEMTKLPSSPAANQASPGFTGQWIRKPGEDIAQWLGPARDNGFMETCFGCHSLRSPLTDGFESGKDLLDQFSPTLLATPIYHLDGQIKEEAYVYGSFLQSKMYQAGVNCLDCHDKHTMKLKLPQQQVCLQCHNSETYDSKTHHGHTITSEGAQCVNCHMPTTNYMVVDARRDHSFKIPRPHLSDALQTPNACTQCHTDQDNQWAAAAVASWHGEPTSPSISEQTFWQLQSSGQVQLQRHLALANDRQQSEIVRATAIEYFSQLPVIESPDTSMLASHFRTWLNSKEKLIRLAATRVAQHLPPAERLKLVSPLLHDPLLAIRIAAANQLLALSLPENSQFEYQAAFKALVTSHEVNSWRGEGRLNHGMLGMAQKNTGLAEEKFRSAIFVDPYFPAAYINLADLYRSLGATDKELNTLQQGLKALPKEPMLHYSTGLYLIRNKQYQQATKSLKSAVKLSPNTVQYAYVYWLAVDNLGQTRQALQQLKQQLKRYQYDRQLVELGLHFSQKLGDSSSYQWLVKYLP